MKLKILAALALLSLVSCISTTNPDGSVTRSVDGPTAIKIIEVIATK